MHPRAKRSLGWWTPFLGSLLVVTAGCDQSYWFGDGPGATAAVSTPSGVQSSLVSLTYTLSGDVTAANVGVYFSTDGSSYRGAAEGPGGDGTKDLSVSPLGDTHTYVWDTGQDLPNQRHSGVMIKVAPVGGTSDISAPVDIHNSRFLLAVERSAILANAPGRVRLYKLDTVYSRIQLLNAYDTGGTNAYDILYWKGFFYVSHDGSNTISVFELDADGESISAVEGSPYSSGGAKARYLATNGARLFVSCVGNTISVLDMDLETGALSWNSSVGANAPATIAVRSSQLFAASESGASILIYDIQSDGSLVLNGWSPVTAACLASPRTLVVTSQIGMWLFAPNTTTADLCGFTIRGGGQLSWLNTTTLSSAGTVQIVQNQSQSANQSRLFAVTGDGARLLDLSIDGAGNITENPSWSVPGPAHGVVSVGSSVVVSTSSTKRFYFWKIGSDGNLALASPDNAYAGADLFRMAVSD